jgi:hypothetical protein
MYPLGPTAPEPFEWHDLPEEAGGSKWKVLAASRTVHVYCLIDALGKKLTLACTASASCKQKLRPSADITSSTFSTASSRPCLAAAGKWVNPTRSWRKRHAHAAGPHAADFDTCPPAAAWGQEPGGWHGGAAWPALCMAVGAR